MGQRAHMRGQGGSGAARTRGKLKITRADGTTLFVANTRATRDARQTVRESFQRAGRNDYDP